MVILFFFFAFCRVRNAVPNEAHYVLARLAIPSLRKKLAPNSQFAHITQNVDGLCGKAIAQIESQLGESSDSELIEMHGRLFDVVCTAHDCDYLEYKPDSPICSALAGTEFTVAEGDLEPVVRRAHLPHCPKCDQLLRPDVVWFGERPKRIHEILDMADHADLCLVIGTSALVFILQYIS